MIRIVQRCLGFPVDLIEVLVPLAFFPEISPCRLEGHTNECRLEDVAFACGIDPHVLRITHRSRRMIDNNLLGLDLLDPATVGSDSGDLLLFVVIHRCLELWRRSLLKPTRIIVLLLERLLEQFSFFLCGNFNVIVDRHLGVDHNSLTQPADLNDRRALINSRANKLVDELHFIKFGSPLMIEHQLILLRRGSVFECRRRYFVQLV